MGFLFNQVFWGIMLILFGIAMIIKTVFQINIPLGRMFFAFLLIYAGIWFLVGGQFGWRPKGNMTLFSESQINYSPSTTEYNIVFGKGTFDTNMIPLNKEGVTKIKLNTVFGAGILKINPDIPAKIVIDSPFAAVTTPDGNTVSFTNDYMYTTKSYQENQSHLFIKADVVFGSLEINE